MQELDVLYGQLVTGRPVAMDAVTWPAHLPVVLFGPHPDDFESVGVTLRHLQRNGNPLHVGVCLTGSGVDDDYCDPPTLEKKAAIRAEEQRRGARQFGLPEDRLTFLHLDQDAEGESVETAANLARVRQFLAPLAPALVFVPHGNDQKPGHRRSYAMVLQVLARTNRPVLVFQNRDPKTMAMRPDGYMPFDAAAADWKAGLLRCHDSQQQRNLKARGSGFDARILAVNAQIAREVGAAAPYAEAFEIEKLNS